MEIGKDSFEGKLSDALVGKAKKPMPLFSLEGDPVPASQSHLPLDQLRVLARAVQDTHSLRGVLRLIDDEWVLGIKLPNRATTTKKLSFLAFRWDGRFGSALTVTVGAARSGWIARGWIWSHHPAVESLRSTRKLTILTVYNGKPVAITKGTVMDNRNQGGFDIAMDVSTEASRRPDGALLELDEGLAYWETFLLSHTWDSLLSIPDHLQLGWMREFQTSLHLVYAAIRVGLVVPDLTDADRQHWHINGLDCPQEVWDGIILPLAEVLRGRGSILKFVREHSSGVILLVIADPHEHLERNPFHEIRVTIGVLADAALLADNRTDFGSKAVFSRLGAEDEVPIEIPTRDLGLDDAKKYWTNLPGTIALNAGDLVSANMQPADIHLILDEVRAIRLGCDRAEAETAIATMTEEANILHRWTIPWGARVQTSLGPFTEIDFYSYGDEISILLKTSNHHYRWAAFNPRAEAWNFQHLLQDRFETLDYGPDNALFEDIEIAIKLVLTSIVRDFVVLEDRESAFAIRRETTPLRGRQSTDDDSPRIIYIPRIRYVQSPDTKALEKGLEYESRRPHHVRAHRRRVDATSPYQRILAERYGFRLDPGFTFVRPHQRGGIAPDREVIYRSRSAMQSLYGIAASIESNGKSDWFRFERDVYEAMRESGFNVDHVASSRNGDAGVDVFAEDSSGEEFWAIQCKCYAPKRKIGPATVRELIGALVGYPAGTKGMLVTTSGYSSAAIALAKQSSIALRLLVVDTAGRRLINVMGLND
jgi:hypothetical protein